MTPDELPADPRAWLLTVARRKVADQELLRLIAWDGLSRTEAAAVLGLNAATVRVRLHRARRRLRRALEVDRSAPEPARARPHPSATPESS